jgi:hypothetical protein
MKPIQEDDNDTAHLGNPEEEPQMVLKFKHANESHEKVMVGKSLATEEGICHKLFEPQEEAQEEVDPDDEEAPKEDAEKDILQTEKYEYVAEVVNEPKMHYW